MALDLDGYVQLVRDEHAGSVGAPLSLRRAILSAVLLANLPDKVFYTYRASAPARVWHALDLPEYRSRIEAECEALAVLHAMCRFEPDTPRLVRETVSVPPEDTESLTLGDFMISLYNQETVQTILVRLPDSATVPFFDLMAAALRWWDEEIARRAL